MPLSQTVAIPGVLPGETTTLMVRVWEGSSFKDAQLTLGYQSGEWSFTTEPLGGVSPSGDTFPTPTMTGWGPESGCGYTLSLPENTDFSRIDSPRNGTVFASPATVSVSAEWYISGAYVTNVSVFANSTLVTSTPLKVLKGSLSGTTDLGAGNYSLVSVLSGPGVNYTSAPVNITVVEPVSLAVGAPQIQGAQFAFQYTVNPGLKYLIESSSDLQVWQPVVTNVPTASPAEFSEAYSADARRFYRVGRLPNP
jgi:hypothetical protein